MKTKYPAKPRYTQLPQTWAMAIKRTGQLPSFTSSGSYTIVYRSEAGDTYCADCVLDHVQAGKYGPGNADEYRATYSDVLWEGPPLQCDDCGEDIESSYGEVEHD